ncbi:MAG: hypothetical protein HDR05_02105 [Lachnospiraceae bacterium]|nr:hypothetical protein [Lachnospiraceae bacterium]
MGLLEPITHKEEVESLLNEAQSMYDNAKNKFESQKKQTTKSLENLGKVKVNAWADGMDTFVTAFDTFKNVEMDRKIETNMNFIGSDEEPKQMLMNIQNASMTANEVAKAGFAALGTGALVGIASYGGAMMFGTASTGTAIAALSGAAKTNATLAWFGGGAKAAGGLGMTGGKLVLAGVVVAPIVAVAAVIAGAKGKEKLAEAKKIHSEAEEAVSQMNVVTTGMEGIAKMSDNYSNFIKKLNKKFAPFLQELDRIKKSHPVDEDGMINFNSLSVVEQKTLHVSWLMAQIYYHVLSTPILNSKGEVAIEASEALSASTKRLKQIKKDTYKMVNEDAQVGNIIWKPEANKMLIINFFAVGIMITLGCLSMDTSVLKGILLILCGVVAFPIFFKFRNLPASRLYTWRLVRLIGSIVIAITVATLL